MKKLTSIITAALIIGCPSQESFNSDDELVMGVTESNCLDSAVQKELTDLTIPTELGDLTATKESEDLTIQRKLEDIGQSVFCFREDTYYANEHESMSPYYMGTAFAFKITPEGRTHLATNYHLVYSEEQIKGSNNGILKLLYHGFRLTEGMEYSDEKADTWLTLLQGELFNKDNRHVDAAVLITVDAKNLPVSQEYVVDPSFEPMLGDEAYSFGCQEGIATFQVRGTLSRKKDFSKRVQNKYVFNIETNQGSSGAPIFIRRGNDLYLVGQIFGFLGTTSFGLATKLEDLIPYWYPKEND